MFEKLSRPLLLAYFVGVSISIPYFNWTYARKNGFFSWLAFGEIIATLDATLWPYYAFRSISYSRSDDENATESIALLGSDHKDANAAFNACLRPIENHLREQFPGYTVQGDGHHWEVFSVGTEWYHCRVMAYHGHDKTNFDVKVVECDIRKSNNGNLVVVSISVLGTEEGMRSKWDAISDYYRNERPDLIVQ